LKAGSELIFSTGEKEGLKMPGGNAGNVLKVDLTARKITKKP
jgi:hypothetical protein